MTIHKAFNRLKLSLSNAHARFVEEIAVTIYILVLKSFDISSMILFPFLL